jgi:hypothetical protein
MNNLKKELAVITALNKGAHLGSAKRNSKKKGTGKGNKKPKPRSGGPKPKKIAIGNDGGSIDRFPSGNKQRQGFGGTTNRNGQVINEMEYIQDLSSSTPAQTFGLLQTFSINPGLSNVFAWGSNISKNYEHYVFDELEFIYKPMVSQFATNGQSGKIILMFDYDASDPAPNSKQVMEDTIPHADGMPYEEIRLKCDPKMLHKMSLAKFVRTNIPPGGTDIKTYDCGNLFIGAAGIATNVGLLGEIHVRYRVRLMTAVLTNMLAQPVNMVGASFKCTNILLPATNTDTLVGYNFINYNGLGMINAPGAFAGTFQFPVAGNYLVVGWVCYSSDATGLTSHTECCWQKGGVDLQPRASWTSATADVSGSMPFSSFERVANSVDTYNVVLKSTYTTQGKYSAVINFVIV